MEIIGSLSSVSGSLSASFFTGSFVGDGSRLTGIPMNAFSGFTVSQLNAGAATASISATDGFVVNTKTNIQGNLVVTGSITATQYIISSSVIYAVKKGI